MGDQANAYLDELEEEDLSASFDSSDISIAVSDAEFDLDSAFDTAIDDLNDFDNGNYYLSYMDCDISDACNDAINDIDNAISSAETDIDCAIE